MPKVIHTICGDFDATRAQKFKDALIEHKERRSNGGEPIFHFEGNEYLQSFAEYLVEFLEIQFPTIQ